MNIEVNKILQSDFRTISRMISMIERLDEEAFNILRNLNHLTGNALTLGITGSPGAGKSTLVNQLINQIRSQGKTIAVLAVDPSSPFSGGAILGDRIRMGAQYSDDGVYIRSLSSHGETGGIPMILGSMIRLLDAAKFDIIIIETVGVGQTELKIMNVADLIAVVLTPESGDSIQMIKAGLMEIADLYVVNKSDRPGSDRLIADLNSTIVSQYKGPSPTPRISKTQATTGEGVEELLIEILDYHEHMKSTGNLIEKKEILRSNETSEIIKYLSLNYINEFVLNKAEFQQVLDEVKTGATDPYTTSMMILCRLKEILKKG